MKTTVFLSIVSILIVFSSPIHAQEQAPGGEKYVVVQKPRTECAVGEEWSVLLEKKDGIWRLNDASQGQQRRISENQEVLCVNLKNRIPVVSVCFEDVGTINKAGYFECSLLLPNSGYTPCNSAFSKTSALGTVGKNVAAAIFTLGLAAGTNKILDFDETRKAIDESDLIAKIQPQEYKLSFSSAKSSAAFKAFILRYAGNDPDGLVAKASTEIERLRQIEDSKRAEVARVAEEKDLAEKEMAKERQRQEIVRREVAKKHVDEFRVGLRVESETNCGPVLEVKGRLVKIYFPVSSYGNEHWIRKEELFPPSYDCRFVNGRYQTPSL